MSNIYAPGKQAINQHSFRLNNIANGYYRIIELLYDNISGSTFNIIPQYDSNIHLYINNIYYNSETTHSLNLASTGIGGIVDGITFTAANARDFLVWGFANNTNNTFNGFGLTHKPYSVFSAVAGGVANKGDGNKDFTVTNAYQFTEGARVCVRNTNGTAPEYEWNWATVDSIQNGTTLRLDMDNASYGTNITSVTGGEILQWNMFRPWVVSGSGQELYTNNYRLCGELYTDTSGNILKIYRIDDRIRDTIDHLIYNSTSVVTGQSLYLGRWIPLWSEYFNSYMYISGNAGCNIRLYNNVNSSGATARIQNTGYYSAPASSLLLLNQNAEILVSTFGTISATGLRSLQYYISTGMRL